jgi:hypothetical protein
MHHHAARTAEAHIEVAVGNFRSIDIANESAAELQSRQFFSDILKFKFDGHSIHSYQGMALGSEYVKISLRPLSGIRL